MQQFEKDGVELRNAIERIERQLASPAYIEGLRDEEFWFDNLVENGGFASGATSWASAGTDSASIVADAGGLKLAGNAYAYQAISTVVGQSYVLTWEISGASAALADMRVCSAADANGDIYDHPSNFGVGTYSAAFVATQPTAFITLKTHHAAGQTSEYSTFDNVSVFPTDGTNIIHRMPTGWKPRRVFVDGILQREGATHDYEIKQDPEGYYIVPAVAPGANTETCILGAKA